MRISDWSSDVCSSDLHGNRLLHHLLGLEEKRDENLPQDLVLIAADLGPAELLDYDQNRLRAVVLEHGAPTSHVAIVARALQIPMVGRCIGIGTEVREGDRIIVDGETGQVLLRPSAAVLDRQGTRLNSSH